MKESRFKRYRDLLTQEAKKARAGEKSKIFNVGNITATILFIVLITVWSFYFLVKYQGKTDEVLDYQIEFQGQIF